MLQLGKMPTVRRLASSVEGLVGLLDKVLLHGHHWAMQGEGGSMSSGIAAVFNDSRVARIPGVFQKTVGLFVDRGWRWVGRVRLCSVALTASHWALQSTHS